MKSDVPKVLHSVCGRPMLDYLLEAVFAAGVRDVVVVAGFRSKEIRDYVGQRARVVIQSRRLGSGHALLQARKAIRRDVRRFLVVCGDTPLLRGSHLRALVRLTDPAGVTAAVLTTRMDNPTGYGRIVRMDADRIAGIVEEKNASQAEKSIREINTGAYCFKAKGFWQALSRVRRDEIKREYYLTDVLGILSASGVVRPCFTEDTSEALGVNSRQDLAVAEAIMRKRTLDRLMDEGVTIKDPATTAIDSNVRIGRDTVIWPCTVIQGPARVGRECHIGPFARIRGGVVLENGVCVGNFVEVVRSRVGKRSMIKHLSYIGDARLGQSVNIGAGTITANFDGKKKNSTMIGDNAQIGSGTVLVAPIRVGKRARTGAGAVVTRGKHVPGGQTVVGVPARPIKNGRSPH